MSDGRYGLSSVGVDPTANSSEDSVGGPFLCVSIVYPPVTLRNVPPFMLLFEAVMDLDGGGDTRKNG